MKPTTRPSSTITRGHALPGRTYASAREWATGSTANSCSGRTRRASAASRFAGVIFSRRGALTVVMPGG
ncbi:hypothetical protein ASR50_18455 [Streptomyces sp. 4F]|nr:hypothetical protein ASR50_18455 [Streptomyces sp. 4F]